jgi:F420-0:gamma-glutamyl ligase
MNITPIKTRLVRANECSIETILTEGISQLADESVVVVSSKIIALCQNNVVDKTTIAKNELAKREADLYVHDEYNTHGFTFTITNNTLIASAGIDESNGDGVYILWPKEPQRVANEIRNFLCQHFNLKKIGVIITDSTSLPPMRMGTIGIMLAHSGFEAVHYLIDTNDLFDRPFHAARSGIGSGLAAAANVVMGEGAEQTPVAIITDIPFVNFQTADPTPEELASVYLPIEGDVYAKILLSAPWQEGGHGNSTATLQ